VVILFQALQPKSVCICLCFHACYVPWQSHTP